jgi:pimeloyl-ACP methyl ester carboxylesterase
MSDNWLSIAKKMSADYCFYLVDLRNHGRSPHSDIFDYDVMTEDIRLFLKENNLSDISLLGHSMGGKVAMSFASKYPRFLQKLIIVDIAPKAYKSSHFKTFIDAMLSLDLTMVESRKEIENRLLQKLNVHPAIIQFLLKNIFRNKNNLFEWRINLPAIKNGMETILDFQVPDHPILVDTLFMKGEYSDYISPLDHGMISRHFPQGKIEGIKNDSHWVHSSAPINFEKSLRNFLQN